MTDGSAPLRKARHERFAQLLAAGGLNQVEAYLRSSPTPVEKTAGRQVAASKLANRDDVQLRVAYLKKERAEARSAAASPITRESVHTLLEETTAALRAASEAAAACGADGIAQALHKVILVHSGRVSRAQTRAPVADNAANDFDSSSALENLTWCSCDE